VRGEWGRSVCEGLLRPLRGEANYDDVIHGLRDAMRPRRFTRGYNPPPRRGGGAAGLSGRKDLIVRERGVSAAEGSIARIQSEHYRRGRIMLPCEAWRNTMCRIRSNGVCR